MDPRSFGQIIAAAQIGIAAGNVALDYSNMTQLQQMQADFQRKLDTDAAMIDYIKEMVDRFTTSGIRLAQSGRYQPNTPEFDKTLASLVADYMNYLGNCNVQIYNPTNPNAPSTKTVWAIINRTGYITPPTNIPPDVGAIWSAGCKDAQDQFTIEFVKAVKSTQQFNIETITQTDIGTINLFLRIGLGTLLVVLMILLIKTQGAVIEEQKDIRVIRKQKVPIKK